jgi:hypothetical protein
MSRLWSLLAEAVVIVSIASFPAVIWFFHFRRRMIRRIANVARDLEAAFRPRDVRYWYLGYLVGFRARYWVNRGPVTRAAALYIIPPYHVFFYLPVIILFHRRERLDLAVSLRRPGIGGEAHIVDTGDKHAMRGLQRDKPHLAKLKSAEVLVAGRRLQAYYSGDGRALDEARRLAAELESLDTRVGRVSVDGAQGAIYVSLRIERPGPVTPHVEAVLRAAGRASKGGEGPTGG